MLGFLSGGGAEAALVCQGASGAIVCVGVPPHGVQVLVLNGTSSYGTLSFCIEQGGQEAYYVPVWTGPATPLWLHYGPLPVNLPTGCLI